MKNKKNKREKKIKKVNIKKNEQHIRFPANLLKPVSEFLVIQLRNLKIHKSKISSEDPFMDESRVLDNAATDTEAEEQFGHARVTAIKGELNNRAKQIKKALKRIKHGKYGICEDCQKMIDTDRLGAYPEATMCINCEKKREK